MDEPVQSKKIIAQRFLSAFEAGDLGVIETLLAPNFVDVRKPDSEMHRYAYLDALRLLFSQWDGCTLLVHNLLLDGDMIALEVTIEIRLHGAILIFERHDLVLFEENRVAAIHEYGGVAYRSVRHPDLSA